MSARKIYRKHRHVTSLYFYPHQKFMSLNMGDSRSLISSSMPSTLPDLELVPDSPSTMDWEPEESAQTPVVALPAPVSLVSSSVTAAATASPRPARLPALRLLLTRHQHHDKCTPRQYQVFLEEIQKGQDQDVAERLAGIKHGNARRILHKRLKDVNYTAPGKRGGKHHVLYDRDKV